MSSLPQDNQPKPLELTPDELARVLRRKQLQASIKVSPEEFTVAEMGFYYGWGGVEAIMYDRLTLEDAVKLIRGARKVWNGHVLDLAEAVYTASAAAQSGKKAGTVMKKGLSKFIKEARVDT